MIWQDLFFAISGVGYTVAMVPSCLNSKTEVPWKTSALTLVLMLGGGLTYNSLGMYLAGSSQFLGAIPWAFIIFRRRIR